MKPEPGMYVKTEGMSDEDYHAVAAAFMGAGAKKGEYPYLLYWRYYEYLGWSTEVEGDGLYHSDYESDYGPNAREVTVDEVLGRDNGWNGEVPPVGTHCEYTKTGSAEQVWWECEVIAMDEGEPVIKTAKGYYHRRPVGEYKFRPLKF